LVHHDERAGGDCSRDVLAQLITPEVLGVVLAARRRSVSHA